MNATSRTFSIASKAASPVRLRLISSGLRPGNRYALRVERTAKASRHSGIPRWILRMADLLMNRAQ